MSSLLPSPPNLRLIANLWTLWDHPSVEQEWSLEQKIAAIKEAGFDGFMWRLDAKQADLARKHDLIPIGFISSAEPREFAALIRQNVDGGARRINVHLGRHDTPAAESVELAIRLMEEAVKQGVSCDIESHRDTCTETPEKTYALAAGYRRATGQLLPITWDFSHFAVVKHLTPPYWDRLLESPELIRHARQFHFRPFNGHHCQVPVTDGMGKFSAEFLQWLPTMEKIFEIWLDGDQSNGELYACPEMGPVRGGYNLAQLPDSWNETKVLREIIACTWETTLRARVATVRQ